MLKKSSPVKISAKRPNGVNAAGYSCPRFNLESRRLAWLKTLRSAGSRAAATAVMSSNTWKKAYEQTIGPERILISMYEMEVQDLHPGFNGLRVVQLTDIHHGPWLPLEFVDAIVSRTNDLKPDIVALTGDYVVNSSRYITPVARALGRLRPTVGTFAVLGNHDWWEGGERVVKAFEAEGIRFVDNNRVVLTPQRELVEQANWGLCIAGVGDAWEDKIDFEAALGGISRRMPRLLLSHNPDCAEDKQLAKGNYRIDLMLSGHTHGGQVCYPNTRQPLLPKIRKNKYARGLVMGPYCPVYVCRGIGTAGIPLRLGADPEIAVFDLVSSAGHPVSASAE